MLTLQLCVAHILKKFNIEEWSDYMRQSTLFKLVFNAIHVIQSPKTG